MRILVTLLIILNIGGCAGTRQVHHIGCYVADSSLRGTYHGQCNTDRVAEGYGKAIGEDTYDGEFKQGLPNGQGLYIWRNGDRYIGQFQRGMASGRGVMLFAAKNCQIEGMWHDNQLKKRILDTCQQR